MTGDETLPDFRMGCETTRPFPLSFAFFSSNRTVCCFWLLVNTAGFYQGEYDIMYSVVTEIADIALSCFRMTMTPRDAFSAIRVQWGTHFHGGLNTFCMLEPVGCVCTLQGSTGNSLSVYWRGWSQVMSITLSHPSFQVWLSCCFIFSSLPLRIKHSADTLGKGR